MAIARLAIFLLVATLVTVSARTANADTGTPDFEIEGPRFQRIDETGAAMWTIEHHAVYREKGAKAVGHPITPPVEHDGHWYYAQGPWLFSLDVDRGVIRKRSLFPDTIAALRSGKDALVVTVAWAAEFPEPDQGTVDFRYRPEIGPPPEQWDWIGTFLAWKDVTYLDASIDIRSSEISEDKRRAMIERMRKVAEQEPGNPFYAFYLGEQYEALGDDDTADKYLDRARDQPAPHWVSDVHLAAMFDERGDYDRADVVFDRALTRGDAVQPSMRQNTALLPMAVLLGVWHTDVVEAALAKNDHEAVDRMLDRTVRLFPDLEDTSEVWRRLSMWHAANDRHELAEKWKSRARAHESGLVPLVREADRGFIGYLASVLAIWLFAFVVGMRSREHKGDSWVRRPRGVDVVAIALIVFLPFVFLFSAVSTVKKIGKLSEAPAGVFTSSWSAPNVINWLENLEPSEERDRLLKHARSVREASVQGVERPSDPPGVQALLFAAIDEHASDRTMEAMMEPLDVELPLPRAFIPGYIVIAVVLGVLGMVVGRKFPTVSRGVQYVIPGGAPKASFLGGIVVLATAISIIALLGVAPLENGARIEPYGKYFGLEQLVLRFPLGRPTDWAWATLAATLALHVVTVLLELRRTSGK